MPDRKLKMVWDMLIILIISAFFCIIPMQLCFDVFYDDEIEEALAHYHLNHYLIVFLVSIPEIMLIIDTLLKFITGFYEDGIIVVDKSEIASHYLRKGLIFDLLSYLPVIMQGIVRKNLPGVFENKDFIIKFTQLLMFFKIKRVRIAISNFEEIIASNGGHDFLLSAFRLMYVILFVTHFNACVWHAGTYYYSEEESWLDYSQLKGEYWLKKYLFSMYWAISVMATIGFGEKISPQNSVEAMIGAFILIVSVFLFGYCINSMKQILDMMTKQENEYK